MDRYKYSVTPFSPIKELIPGKSIRAPFVADLDKEEVFMCMKHGPVFRLFPGKEPIRVTGSNFETLHKSKFEDIEEVQSVVKEKVSITPVVAPIIKEKVEEVVEPTPVEEDIKIFDKEEIRDTYSIEKEITPEEKPIEAVEAEVEPIEFAEENLPKVESEVESEEVESVEEESDEVAEEEDEEEASVEETVAENSQNHKPQFKANYNGYSKKKNRNKNHNH